MKGNPRGNLGRSGIPSHLPVWATAGRNSSGNAGSDTGWYVDSRACTESEKVYMSVLKDSGADDGGFAFPSDCSP